MPRRLYDDPEHERNRAKRMRFYHRHREELRRQEKFDRIIACKTSNSSLFRTYELADPRDEEQKPLLVGFCVRGVLPWEALWKVKDVSYGLWASWMRNLASLRLTPVDRRGWALGRAAALPQPLAQYLVRERLKLIRTEGQPRWLLNLPRKRIGCVHEDGRVLRYPGVRYANRITGFTVLDLELWINTTRGKDGWKWFDDRAL